MNSFVAGTEELKGTLDSFADRIVKTTPEELKSLLTPAANSIIYFTQAHSSPRALTQTVGQAPAKPSLLFINMTPSVLSGLFVTLFLVIMLLIGVSCLYNIKTNDKFGVNNLVVGRES